MPPKHQCMIALCFDESCDCRCYNLPTAASNEIAAIIPGSSDEPTAGHNIILHRKAGEGLKHILKLHPFYPALCYVLLFPTGQLDWRHQLKYQNDVEANDQENAQQPPPGGEMAGAGPSKCKCMSMWEFLAFHLHPRQQSSNHLFHSGKLFHEYLWAICKQSHLNYLQSNQGKLHSDLYSALMTAIQDNPGANPADMGMSHHPSIHVHWEHTKSADKLSGLSGS
jgi:hypothetical protein